MTTELFFAAAFALSLAAAIIVALTKGGRPDDRVQNNSETDMFKRDR
jgi:hypothetical protein